MFNFCNVRCFLNVYVNVASKDYVWVGTQMQLVALVSCSLGSAGSESILRSFSLFWVLRKNRGTSMSHTATLEGALAGEVLLYSPGLPSRVLSCGVKRVVGITQQAKTNLSASLLVLSRMGCGCELKGVKFLDDKFWYCMYVCMYTVCSVGEVRVN